jgi:hypothetical protein
MKKVFFDTEFTRAGMNTSLVSIGFVTENNESLYLELSDFDQTQITPWLEDNILCHLEGIGVSRGKAVGIIEDWLGRVGCNSTIQLISAGKSFDLMLLFDLWAEVEEGSTLRTWRDRIPEFLDHKWHMDLDTIFALRGIDPQLDRVKYSNYQFEGIQHHSLFDALIVKACWEKLMQCEPRL